MTTSGPRPTLTRTGSAVALGSFGLVLLGWALGYVVLTVAGAIAAAAVLSGLAATFVVPKLAVERAIQPTRVERGNPAFGLLSLHNPASRRTWPCEAVETIRSVDSERRAEDRSDDDIVIAVPSMRPGKDVSVPYRLPTRRRGTLRVGPLAIERRDPLGLWHSRRPVGDAVTLLVEPHVFALDPRPAGRARHLDGPVSEKSPRGTQTFHSLREYSPGDDIRRVHWRSTARTGTLMVREHVDTTEPSTVVVLDLRADRYTDERFEDAVDVAASVAAASQSNGFPVRLVTSTGASIMVRSGQRGRGLADFLTTVEPLSGEASGDLSLAAIEVLRGRERDAITVITGDAEDRDLALTSSMTNRFSRPSLVTLRPVSGVRWTGGQHLDGDSARTALQRWQLPQPRPLATTAVAS